MTEIYEKEKEVILTIVQPLTVFGEKEIETLPETEYKYKIRKICFDFIENLISVMKELKAKQFINQSIENGELSESYRNNPKAIKMIEKKLDDLIDDAIKNYKKEQEDDTEKKL